MLQIKSESLQDGTKLYDVEWTMTLSDTMIAGGLTTFSDKARVQIVNPCNASELVPSLTTLNLYALIGFVNLE